MSILNQLHKINHNICLYYILQLHKVRNIIAKIEQHIFALLSSIYMLFINNMYININRIIFFISKLFKQSLNSCTTSRFIFKKITVIIEKRITIIFFFILISIYILLNYIFVSISVPKIFIAVQKSFSIYLILYFFYLGTHLILIQILVY